MKEATGFNLERKGYCKQEVDKRLQELLQELERLKSENASLQYSLNEAVKRADELEGKRDLIEETLLRATAAAQQISENAEAEAEAIIQRARETDVRQLDVLDEKKKQLTDLRNRVEYILRSQLALLEQD